MEESTALVEAKTEEAANTEEAISEVSDKLVEAEVVIEQLRRENLLQRKEVLVNG